MHSITDSIDGKMDRQADDSIMPIADLSVWQYEWLKMEGKAATGGLNFSNMASRPR